MAKATLTFATETAAGPDAIVVLRPQGQIQTETAEAMEAAFSTPPVSTARRLLVDLSDVEYVSSAGWGLLIAQLRLQRDRAGDLRICTLRPPVQEIFEMLQFPAILKAYATAAEAAAAWDGEPARPSKKKSG